jgi:asparagine synthase (glutamine-hydrolysing)
MVLITGDMDRLLPKLAWHFEQTRIGQSFSGFHASQLARSFVEVIFLLASGINFFAVIQVVSCRRQ